MRWAPGAAVVAAIAIVAGLAILIPPADEPATGPTLPNGTWVEHLPIGDRLVTCVYSSYGMSCDWDGSRLLAETTTHATLPPA